MALLLLAYLVIDYASAIEALVPPVWNDSGFGLCV